MFEVFNGPWFMEPIAWEGYMMNLMALSENGGLDLEKIQAYKKAMFEHQLEEVQKMAIYDANVALCHSSRCDECNTDCIAVYFIDGPITKNNWFDFSTDDFISEFTENEQNDQVLAHLFIVSSGGGEATHCEIAQQLVCESQKPTLALVDGTCCSGAYYIVCGADTICCTSVNDIVGSIGVMSSFRDAKPALEKMGFKFHTVMATQSTEKNKMFFDVLKGNYEEYVAERLDPLCAQFCDAVAKARPKLDTTPESRILNGKTYLASDAVKNGIIDKICTMKEGIDMLRTDVIQNLGNQIFTF